MNNDLRKLIEEFKIDKYYFNSWNTYLPDGNQFEWKFTINSTNYKLHKFVPEMVGRSTEWTLWELLKGSTNLLLSGDEEMVLQFFKPHIRELKLNELGVNGN